MNAVKGTIALLLLVSRIKCLDKAYEINEELDKDKTLLTETQQASLVLSNVSHASTPPAFTGFFSETVPKKKLKKIKQS